MRKLLLLTLLSATACSGKETSDDTGALGDGDPSNNADADADEGAESDTLQATIRLLDATSGAGFQGATIEAPDGSSATTGMDGGATLSLEKGGTFEFRVRDEGAIDHLIFGPTGNEDFTYLTFVATESLLSMVNGLLGTSQATGTGLMVVAIDYDDLTPAVGATASIGSAHDSSWVMGTAGPTFGNTIPTNGGGFVVFPNIPPGETSITVVPPTGVTCSAFPGGGQMPNAPVLMNHVSVVTFHCR